MNEIDINKSISKKLHYQRNSIIFTCKRRRRPEAFWRCSHARRTSGGSRDIGQAHSGSGRTTPSRRPGRAGTLRPPGISPGPRDTSLGCCPPDEPSVSFVLLQEGGEGGKRKKITMRERTILPYRVYTFIRHFSDTHAKNAGTCSLTFIS